jgi:hypothetical protein
MAGTTNSAAPRGSQPSSTPAPAHKRAWWRWIIYALLLLAINYALVALLVPGPAQGDRIQGRLKQPVSYTPPGASQALQVTAFATVQPTFSDPNLLTEMEQQGVIVNATSLAQTMPWWENLLLSFGPSILLIGGFLWLTNRTQGQLGGGGGLFGIGREAILKVHTRTVPLAPDTSLAQVAATTPGLVGADLRNLVNEAALLAARRGEDTVHQKDFLDALADPLVIHESLDEREILAVTGLSRAGTILPLPPGMGSNNGHATLTPSTNERSN